MVQKYMIYCLTIGLSLFNAAFAAERVVICETLYSET